MWFRFVKSMLRAPKINSVDNPVHAPLFRSIVPHAVSPVNHKSSYVRACRLCRRGRAPGALGSALLESVGELARDQLEGSHAAGTGGLSPLGLLAPVVYWMWVSMTISGEVVLNERR